MTKQQKQQPGSFIESIPVADAIDTAVNLFLNDGKVDRVVREESRRDVVAVVLAAEILDIARREATADDAADVVECAARLIFAFGRLRATLGLVAPALAREVNAIAAEWERELFRIGGEW